LSNTDGLYDGEKPQLEQGQGERQRHAAWALIYLIFTLLIAATVPADLKNLRYVTILVGPCCLLSGLAVVYLLAFAKVKLPLWGTISRLALLR
jgi:hypothetical protein